MGAPLNNYYLCGQIADVGTASTLVFVVPENGWLRQVETVLNDAITGADDVITVSVNGSALSPTITIANASSAAGDYDVGSYYAAVKQGDRVTVANSGASTGVAAAGVTLTFSS